MRPDRVVVDFSPLRLVSNTEARKAVEAICSSQEYKDKISLNIDLSSDKELFMNQTTPQVPKEVDLDGNVEGTKFALALTHECLLLRPIWDLPVLLLTYDCKDRKTAKKFARHIAQELCIKKVISNQNGTDENLGSARKEAQASPSNAKKVHNSKRLQRKIKKRFIQDLNAEEDDEFLLN